MSLEKSIRKILSEATPASARAKNDLVRSGLGHDTNSAAVMKALEDPESAMKTPAKREILLKVMQDLLDVVVNDPSMVSKTKSALRKEEVEETISEEELEELKDMTLKSYHQKAIMGKNIAKNKAYFATVGKKDPEEEAKQKAKIKNREKGIERVSKRIDTKPKPAAPRKSSYDEPAEPMSSTSAKGEKIRAALEKYRKERFPHLKEDNSSGAADSIMQRLAHHDINSKVVGNEVHVYKSEVPAAKRHLKKAGFTHKVVGKLQEELEDIEEKLIGGQKKIDANKNGKLDAEDFKKLRGMKEAAKCKDDEENEKDDEDEVAPRKSFKAFKKDMKEAKKIKINFKMPPESAAEKLHRKQQELRKKAGRPHPDYYKELGKSYDIEDDKERHAKQSDIKKKYSVKEETQIDELKKSTLGSYIKKASDDINDKAFSLGHDFGANQGNRSSRLKTDKKLFNRTAGISKATDKLTKEETQIDELKKSTLASYVSKSAGSYGRDKQLIGRESPDGTIKNARPEMKRAVKNRLTGINRAATKLAKEETQIDEAFPTVDDAKKRMKDALKSKFEKKKISTGTVYTRKQKEDEKPSDK